MTLSLGLSVRPLPLTIRHYRVTLETCDLWDIWSEWWRGMTWLDYFGAILETCDLYDICSEWWGDLTWPKKPLRCCDIWDTDYNTDNWEPEFMTIFVFWQLIVTLDSIRNSCDVCFSDHQVDKTFVYWSPNYLANFLDIAQSKLWFNFAVLLVFLSNLEQRVKWSG